MINHSQFNNVEIQVKVPRRLGPEEDVWTQEVVFLVHVAVREIHPGQEIFDHFGPDWIEDRGLTDRTSSSSSGFDPSWTHHGGPRCSKLASGFGHESVQRMIDLGGLLQKPSVHFRDLGCRLRIRVR